MYMYVLFVCPDVLKQEPGTAGIPHRHIYYRRWVINYSASPCLPLTGRTLTPADNTLQAGDRVSCDVTLGRVSPMLNVQMLS